MEIVMGKRMIANDKYYDVGKGNLYSTDFNSFFFIIINAILD